MTTRRDTIFAMFQPRGRGLEIGPSYNPLVPKREGFDVEIVDHASTDELRAKYEGSGEDSSLIEEVDYVWTGQPLSELCGKNRFDYIVASHVIEHTPDLLRFLLECEAMLRPNGTLFLAVPDKRRCFDVLRPISTTGQVLQAHHEQRRFHSPSTAFDHVASLVTLNGVAGWGKGTLGTLTAVHTVDQAVKIFERNAPPKVYEDFHAWTFVPSSFRLILADLANVGGLGLRETSFQLADNHEFFIALQPGERDPPNRVALLIEAQRELLEFPWSPESEQTEA